MHVAQIKIFVLSNAISDVNIHALELPALHTQGRHGPKTYVPKNVYLLYPTFGVEMLSLPSDTPPSPQHTHPQAQH